MVDVPKYPNREMKRTADDNFSSTRNKWHDSYAIRFGLQPWEVVHDEEGGKMVVKKAKCRFCECFGRSDPPTREKRLRQRMRTVYLVGPRFRSDNILHHLTTQHAEKYKEYNSLSVGAKERFFPETSLTANVLSTQHAENACMRHTIVSYIVSKYCQDKNPLGNRWWNEFIRLDFETGGPLPATNHEIQPQNWPFYVITISNPEQFNTIIEMVALGLTFDQIISTIQLWKATCTYSTGLNHMFQYVCPRDLASMIRKMIGLNFQHMQKVLASTWTLVLVLDSKTLSEFNLIKIELHCETKLGKQKFHLLCIDAGVDHETLLEELGQILDLVDPNYLKKLIGITRIGSTNDEIDKGIQLVYEKATQTVPGAMIYLSPVREAGFRKVLQDSLAELNRFQSTLFEFIRYLREQPGVNELLRDTSRQFSMDPWSNTDLIIQWMIQQQEGVKIICGAADEAQHLPEPTWWIFLSLVETILRLCAPLLTTDTNLTQVLVDLKAQFSFQTATDHDILATLAALDLSSFGTLHDETILSEEAKSQLAQSCRACVNVLIDGLSTLDPNTLSQNSIPPQDPLDFVKMTDTKFMTLLQSHKERILLHKDAAFLHSIVTERQNLVREFQIAQKQTLNIWQRWSSLVHLKVFAKAMALFCPSGCLIESQDNYTERSQREGSLMSCEGQYHAKQFRLLKELN